MVLGFGTKKAEKWSEVSDHQREPLGNELESSKKWAQLQGEQLL